MPPARIENDARYLRGLRDDDRRPMRIRRPLQLLAHGGLSLPEKRGGINGQVARRYRAKAAGELANFRSGGQEGLHRGPGWSVPKHKGGPRMKNVFRDRRGIAASTNQMAFRGWQ